MKHFYVLKFLLLFWEDEETELRVLKTSYSLWEGEETDRANVWCTQNVFLWEGYDEDFCFTPCMGWTPVHPTQVSVITDKYIGLQAFPEQRKRKAATLMQPQFLRRTVLSKDSGDECRMEGPPRSHRSFRESASRIHASSGSSDQMRGAVVHCITWGDQGDNHWSESGGDKRNISWINYRSSIYVGLCIDENNACLTEIEAGLHNPASTSVKHTLFSGL